MKVIGIETEACAAVSVVDKVPEKPLPETVKVAVPAVVLLFKELPVERGIVTVPACPAVPFAVKVPVEVAVPQLKVNVATCALTTTVGLQVPVA